MLVRYQRNWEGSSLATPAVGVIAFYPLNDGVIKQIWLRVRTPPTHPLRFAVYYGDETDYVTDFRVEIGETLSGATLPDGYPVEMFKQLRLDLIETNGGVAHIPIVIEYAIEEEVDLSYNDLQDIPSTFTPSVHSHDDRYFTEAESLSTFIGFSQINIPTGVAGLDGGGKVAAAQLPSYVDDILEFANLAAFPGTGETGKQYLAIDTGKTYRWSGSVYAEISASPGSTDAVTEGATNKYFTEARVRATILTGLSLVSSLAVSAADTFLVAIGKLQKQITDVVTELGAYIISNDAAVANKADASELNNYQLLSEKGEAGGYASLDIEGVVPIGQLPEDPRYSLALAGVVVDTAAIHVIDVSENNQILYLVRATGIICEIPNDLPIGFTCLVIQGGVGQVQFMAADEAVLNSPDGYLTSRTQFSGATVACVEEELINIFGDLIL